MKPVDTIAVLIVLAEFAWCWSLWSPLDDGDRRAKCLVAVRYEVARDQQQDDHRAGDEQLGLDGKRWLDRGLTAFAAPLPEALALGYVSTVSVQADGTPHRSDHRHGQQGYGRDHASVEGDVAGHGDDELSATDRVEGVMAVEAVVGGQLPPSVARDAVSGLHGSLLSHQYAQRSTPCKGICGKTFSEGR